MDAYSFYLVRDATGELVDATYRYDAEKKRAFLKPSAELRPGGHTATVYSGPFGVKTADGDPIMRDKAWSFEVAR